MMDRKDKRTPVTEIFPRGEETKEHLLPVRTQIEKFEEKARLNFNKNRPAPQPPGRNFILPKIGNYQPKSLLLSNGQDKSGAKSDFQKLNDKNETVEEPKKYMVIGDKDTPITIHQSSDVIDSPPENEFFPRFGSDNPVFEPEEITPTNSDEKDSVLDFEKTVKNPLFEENEDKDNIPSQRKASDDVEMTDVSSFEKEDDVKPTHKKRPAPPPPILASQNEEFEAEIPAPDYEPEPDYDEEEVPKTKDIYPPAERRKSSSAREYGGEDFSKYMHDSEDEDYFSDHTLTWRNKIKYKRKPAPNRPVSQPGRKKDNRPKPKQHQVKSTGQSASNQISEEEGRRKTIRDFSFSDCKIGYDDRTVKSTSAVGRYMKRGKDRLPLQQVTSTSYEDFLRTRYTENGSNGSADSGHETGDDFDVHAANLFRQSQPKQLKTGSKQSMWEKLTWRFKSSSRGYAMT